MEKNQNDTISEKPKKKKHLATKIIFFSLLSIPIVYLLFQMYSIYYRPYTTQTAIEVTLSDTIQATGIIGRNEAVLPSLEGGVPLYVVDDGLRVSAGANVAEVYSDIYQVNSKEKIDILNKKIEDLQYAQNDGVVAGTDVDTVLKDLQTNYIGFLDAISKNDFNDVLPAQQAFNLSVNRLQVSTGMVADYNALVDVLTQQRDELIAATVPVNMVTAPQPGFYISSIDGLETTFTQDFVKGLTSQDILTAEENFTQTVQTQTSGKIISDYKWYFVCAVPKTQAARFVDAPAETKVTIKFQDSTAGAVPAFIESVTDEETSEYVKVVLRCEVMRPDIANLRFETADISFRTIKGIRIAKSATNIVDGELGVYIKYGHLVSFKKITPIFENSEYILVPLNPNKEITGINEVKLFDEVIVEGKDLYDGKLL